MPDFQIGTPHRARRSAAITDISDLVYLVDYMFEGGAVPPSCL